MQPSSVVSRTSRYYNSKEVLSFQEIIYNHHNDHCSVGLYDDGQESIHEAMYKTVVTMASLLPLNESSIVLDLGAGYGGAARYLAKTTGCSVDPGHASNSTGGGVRLGAESEPHARRLGHRACAGTRLSRIGAQ